MTNSLKQNLSNGETWIRLLYVLLFVAIYSLGVFVLAAIVTLQFGFLLLMGKHNNNLLRFGGSLSRYMYDVLLYFTFRSDNKPYPFRAWPSANEPATTRKKSVRKKAAKPQDSAD